MAQFDIYRNPSPRSSGTRPYVIELQSNRFAKLTTRLVAALALKSAAPRLLLDAMDWMPALIVQRREVYFTPVEITVILASRLGPPIASLAEDEDAKRRIQRALDDVLAHY